MICNRKFWGSSLFIFVMSVSILSCVHHSKENNTVTIPENMLLIPNGIVPDKKNPYRMIYYVDSLACTPCTSKKLYQLSYFEDYFERHNDVFSLFVIISPQKGQEKLTTEIFRESIVDQSFYVDTASSFKVEQLHEGKVYVCLADSCGNVLLEGDPFTENELYDKYWELIHKKVYDYENKIH